MKHNLDSKINELKQAFQDALHDLSEVGTLDALYNQYFGRKGLFTEALRTVKDVVASERPRIGKLANEVKTELETLFTETKRRFSADPDASAPLDVTLPGVARPVGSLHPLTLMRYQIEDISRRMGFLVLDGPEIESEYYNFNALNVPSDHPARDTQDTFWLTDGNLLRTHTSPVQVRALQKYGAPFRAIVPGRVFRYESTDASHDHTFYQVEGLLVDENIGISDLIGVMSALLQGIFNTAVEVRLRPGFFPFVEPGFELDMKCLLCRGDGCPACKRVGWIEMIGCGLVHPAVLRAGNVDPVLYSGFAFGIGMTRLAMMRFGIDDIRMLMSGDVRFSKQF